MKSELSALLKKMEIDGTAPTKPDCQLLKKPNCLGCKYESNRVIPKPKDEKCECCGNIPGQDKNKCTTLEIVFNSIMTKSSFNKG